LEQAETTNLADIILAKIAEHEAGGPRHVSFFDDPQEDEVEQETVEIPLKVQEVYTKTGYLLSRYKSGRLPKPFKIIPTLPVAMQHTVIPLTRPENWTPNAIYEATRLFISSNAATAQSFLSTVLLDRVREEIHETRKLNVHLYNSLKKSLYKPAAFFKGFLFPLLTNACTLREAQIVSSVMTRVSIPVLHSAAALSRCCDIAAEQMAHDPEAAGATNLCVKVLLDKKYALPYQTIDALVFHFLRFRPVPVHDTGDVDKDLDMHGFGNGRGNAGDGKLPVIWHQCLLIFAQRYRDEIAEEQREALLDLLLVRGHKSIGPEIRRELLAGRGRGEVVEPLNGLGHGGDDTLMAD
jgi:essential nuclear protein 1